MSRIRSFDAVYGEFMVESLRTQRDAMLGIKKALDEAGVSFVFVGGAILPEYNYARFTEDVDILVDSRDRDGFMGIPPGIARVAENGRMATFHHPAVKVDVLWSGDAVGSAASGIKFPSPELVANEGRYGLPVLSLEKLVEFKLCSGMHGENRLCDFGDVQQLIVRNDLPEDFAKGFSEEAGRKYLEIWNATGTGGRERSS